ncbi:unnamed protein product [Haemonchus placei]|uniref:CASP-like protein n=1 Tax=Haemonchus placei TaxID=6290 RepID=A0A0N4WR97_HAEPC|nr:unnamed protein product [Haemonchus placei]
MAYQIHTSTPCRPGIPSASEYIFPISPSCRNALIPHSILKKPGHSLGSTEMISSQTSDSSTASTSKNSQNSDRVKLKIALRLLTTMAVATGVLCVMSLQFFLQVNWSVLIAKYVTLKQFYVCEFHYLASEIGETLDVAVLICSTTAFFISLLQIFFVLKLYKSHNAATMPPHFFELARILICSIVRFFQSPRVSGSYEFHASGHLFILVSLCGVHDSSNSAVVCAESSPRNDIERSGTLAWRIGNAVLRGDYAEDDPFLDAIHIVTYYQQ